MGVERQTHIEPPDQRAGENYRQDWLALLFGGCVLSLLLSGLVPGLKNFILMMTGFVAIFALGAVIIRRAFELAVPKEPDKGKQ